MPKSSCSVFPSCSRTALYLIARSARCDVRWVAAVENPPPSSSLAEKKRLCSLLLRAAARDFRRSQLPSMLEI
jgi:hypothetical protein